MKLAVGSNSLTPSLGYMRPVFAATSEGKEIDELPQPSCGPYSRQINRRPLDSPVVAVPSDAD